MIHPAVPALVLGVAFSPAFAQSTDPDAHVLFDVLSLPEMVEIMRLEGLAYGAEIGAGVFGETVPAEWVAAVEAIHDEDQMLADARDALISATAGQDLKPMIAFFSRAPGDSFIRLETTARRALLHDDVETAAKEAAAIAMADQTARYLQIKEFVEANDLIETNVTAAMNTTYSFYLGMLDGGAFPGETTADDLLRDVWTREPEIRTNTTEWVYSFLLMAYDPVSDADLEAYIAFSETGSGQSLNRAIFGAFDDMFDDISHSLGLAAARYVAGESL
jgi:hypothetical protein